MGRCSLEKQKKPLDKIAEEKRCLTVWIKTADLSQEMPKQMLEAVQKMVNLYSEVLGNLAWP